MKRKLYSLLSASAFILMAQSVMAQVTFVLNQAPCNNNGIITANFNNLTTPGTVTWYLNGGTIVTHSGVTGTSDVLTGYSGSPFYVVVNSNSSGQGQDGTYPGALPFNYQVATVGAICPAMGTATATVTGGLAPYTYQWLDTGSNVVGTTNPISLPDGEYQIIITDANGCTSGSYNVYDSIYVHSEAAFNYTLSSTTANCTNGTATVGSFTGTGVLPYTYSWSNGATSASISGLTAGNYAVTVTDAQGCHRTKDKHIAQGIVINANATVSPATCVQNNGSIITFGSGGMPPYTYLYNNGTTTQTASGLSAGPYSVTITDANGCTGSTSSYVGSSTPVNVTYTATTSSCTSPTGTATLTINGGQPPYTTTWSTYPAQTGTTATGLGAGTYHFHVVDANGCIRDGVVPIAPVNVISASVTVANPVCPQTNGSISVIAVSGGTAPYTYSWSNNPAITASSQTNIPTGGYSIEITDANGCSVTKYGSIEAISPVGVGLVATPTSCIYSSDGSVTSSVWGGTAPYTYAWSNGQTTSSITGLQTGSYYLTATDANGCHNANHANVTYGPGTSCYCTISGKVYNDANGNCVMDAGETGISNISIHCSGQGYTYTNANGDYSFHVPTGSYTISQTVLATYPLAACQNNNIAVTTVAAAGCVQTVNFANTTFPLHDMHVSLWNSNAAVPGNAHHQLCVISNQGTVAENAILAGYKSDGQLNAATFAPSGIFSNPSANYYSTSGNTFPTLAPGTSNSFSVNYNVPTNIPLGTALVFRDSAVSSGPMTNWVNDYSPWNNVNYHTETVVSSFDPNFIQVNTQGTGAQGYISRNDSTLNYMVHFQNEGTYFAQNVVVIDTLSDKLDWKSLRPITSSHNATVSIDENGVLKYTFKNIQLPAKMYNEPGSNGMFVYSIKLKSNLPYGTQIKNKAGIYFDYNEPVITNQVLNTLKEPTGIQHPGNVNGLSFNIYPNPAQSSFTAMVDNKIANASSVITITDISGRVILTKSMNLPAGKQLIEMNTNSLRDGIYFVNLNIAGTKGTQKLVIVK